MIDETPTSADAARFLRMHDHGTPPQPSRRSFCLTACHAATAAAAQLTSINGTVTGLGVTVVVDGTSPLAAVGSAAIVRSTSGDFLVSRSGTDTFVALTAICTHEACTITGFRASTYVCPCHGSTYSTAGTVLTGPATRSLRTFPTQFATNTNTLTISA
jgi:cytochrome b6-f complex iron-sulfur subunit